MIKRREYRGSVIVLALWALGIAAIVTSSIQIFAQRQSLQGIEVRDRIQARWAARAGIESTIAVMSDHTIRPVPQNSFAMVTDMEYVAAGTAGVASWDIRHHVDGQDWAGPMDEHSKVNINSDSRGYWYAMNEHLLVFGVVESIEDWIDEDDEPRLLGVERDYYTSLATDYEPRNGLIKSIPELELIAGVMPDDVRGEDWDIDYRLDSNEDDGGESLPWDEPDQYLQGGWASELTTSSVDGGASESGEPRINLKTIDLETMQIRLGVDPFQAEALKQFANGDGADLSVLLTQTLRTLSGNADGVTNLTDDQLRLIFSESMLFDQYQAPPGKININTVSSELLYGLFPDNSRLVEELLYLRANKTGGISSPLDFREIPGIDPAMIQNLNGLFDTKSNVYTISSLGKSNGSGIEQEIIVVVDRSTIPVTILEYREQ